MTRRSSPATHTRECTAVPGSHPQEKAAWARLQVEVQLEQHVAQTLAREHQVGAVRDHVTDARESAEVQYASLQKEGAGRGHYSGAEH